MSKWQSIETAPKDGKPILTCYRGVDYKINWFNNTDDLAPGYRLGSNGWWCSAKNQQPTHWMPLPQPPSE